MKILHLPLNVPGSEQVGQEKGFREVFGDENYRQFDFLNLEGQLGKEATNQQLIALVNEFQPEIIWAQLQETDTIIPQTWATIKEQHPELWLTCWSGDAREYVPTGMQQWLKYFDIFYNDTDQKELYQPFCTRYEFMPIAVDPDEGTDYSHDTGLRVPEVIFIGNNYGTNFSNGPFRLELMKALSKEFGDKFGVYGFGWDQSEVNFMGSCPVKQQSAYYHKAKVVISVDHIKGILHWSERLIWAMMSGTPTLVERQPGLSKYLHNVFLFESVDGCIRAIHELLDDSLTTFYQTPTAVAQLAKDEALKHHTWKQRAETVKSDYETR